MSTPPTNKGNPEATDDDFRTSAAKSEKAQEAQIGLLKSIERKQPDAVDSPPAAPGVMGVLSRLGRLLTGAKRAQAPTPSLPAPVSPPTILKQPVTEPVPATPTVRPPPAPAPPAPASQPPILKQPAPPPAPATRDVPPQGVGAQLGSEVEHKVGQDLAEGIGRGLAGKPPKPPAAPPPPAPAPRGPKRTKPASPAVQSLDTRWSQQREGIVDAAHAVGVDPGVLARIAAFESGFNPDAAPIARNAERNRVRLFDGRMGISSAHGLGQFTDATWRDTLNRYGGAHGIAGAGQRGGRPGSLTNEQVHQYRADPRMQAAMLAELTRDNVELGRRIGGASDDANVYALHNLGVGDGSRLLQAVRNSPNITVREALAAGRALSPQEAHRIEAVISGNQTLYGDGAGSVQLAYGRMAQVMAAGDRHAAEARTLLAERVRTGAVPVAAAPAPAPAPAAQPAARHGLTAEALRGPANSPPPAVRPRAPDRTEEPAPAPPAAVRVSVSADRPVQVAAVRTVAGPRAPVVAVVALLPAAPPVAEVFRAAQGAQNRDQDDRPPESAPRRSAPPDRGVAHSVRAWPSLPRISRDPFEVA